MEDLQSLFNTTNPFMWQQGFKALDQAQAKRQQDMEIAKAAEARAVAMSPVEIAHKQSLTGLNAAQTQQMNLNNELTGSVPLKDRTAAYLAELQGKVSDQERKRLTDHMAALQHYSSLAAGGKLSLEDLTTAQKKYPGIEQFLTSPQGLKNAQRALEVFARSNPEYVKSMDLAKEHSRSAAEVANINAEARKNAAAAKAAAGAPSKMNIEQSMAYYNRLAQETSDPELKAQYQAEADRYELIMLRKARDAAQAGQAGKPALAPLGIQTQGNEPLVPTPRKTEEWKPPAGWK